MDNKTRTYEYKQSKTWWLGNRRYALYMVRELSGFAVALYGFMFLAQLFALTQGPIAYASLLRVLLSPAGILLSAILLGFAVFHSLTWFDLTAKVQPPKLKGKPVPRKLVVAGNIIIWLFISYFAVVFIFRVG